jgi:hypothetical protein
MVRGIIKPLFTAILAVATANCLPRLAPNADELETAYRKELKDCVEKYTSTKASCECRKAVDEKWGICKWTEESWPKIGRCDVECF